MESKIQASSLDPSQRVQSPYAEDLGQPELLRQESSTGSAQDPGFDSGFSKVSTAVLTQDLSTLLVDLQDLGHLLSELGQTGQGGGDGAFPPVAVGTSPGGPGPANVPGSEPTADDAPGVSGSAAPAGSGALGPNVPAALQPYVQYINAAAQQTGVSPSLVGAQILQESGGNPNAVTTNPALGLPDTGLMQVDQATFQGLQQQYPSLLGGKSVADPATNIMAGALLDAQLLKQHNGDIGAALTAYNGAADTAYVNEVTAKMTALENGTPVPGGFS